MRINTAISRADHVSSASGVWMSDERTHGRGELPFGLGHFYVRLTSGTVVYLPFVIAANFLAEFKVRQGSRLCPLGYSPSWRHNPDQNSV